MSRGRPPLYFVIPAAAVGLAMLLPLAYLLLRTWEAGGEALWQLLSRERTLRVLLNTAGLAAAVAAGAVALGVPLAWLTARTDLPGRAVWSVLVVLPLAIPSLVSAFAFVSAWGHGGLIHQWVLQFFPMSTMPNMYGFT